VREGRSLMRARRMRRERKMRKVPVRSLEFRRG
jgi:hypothetical protein